MRNSTTNWAIMRDHTPLMTSSMLTRETPHTTSRTTPTGGVISRIAFGRL